MKTFKDIIAWQKGYKLTLLIYKLTSKFPKNEEFGLKSELRRAAISFMSNVAEGFYKKSKKEELHFYNRSECSLEEIKCQSLVSTDLSYLNRNEYQKLINLSDECGKTLYGWMEAQRNFMETSNKK